MYKSMKNSTLCTIVCATNELGIMRARSIRYRPIAGKISGIDMNTREMEVCRTACWAAAWLLPTALLGYAGSKMSIPRDSSVCLIM